MVLEVRVNVYDLPNAQRTNGYLVGLGLGLFHSGVEINGAEYSFSPAGVCRAPPRLPEYGTFKEQLQFGTFSGSMNDLQLVLERLRTGTFRAGQYDLIHLNCNCFSDALVFELTRQHLPEWVNRAASIASSVATKPAAQSSAPQQGFAAPGLVSKASPPFGVKAAAPATAMPVRSQQSAPVAASSSSGVFGWFSSLLGSSSAGPTTPGSSSAAAAAAAAPSAVASMPQKMALDKEDKSKKKEMSNQQREMLDKLRSKVKTTSS